MTLKIPSISIEFGKTNMKNAFFSLSLDSIPFHKKPMRKQMSLRGVARRNNLLFTKAERLLRCRSQ